MSAKGKKRESDVITGLILQVESILASDPDISVQAACKEVGLRKETYYYRKRTNEATSNSGLVWPSKSVKTYSPEELMKEFLEIDKRAALLKSELAARLG